MVAPVAGSSPLTRGKPVGVKPADLQWRLIPAHAGKTARVSILPSHESAHPRSRGENRGFPAPARGSVGSSPLTRGKPATKPRRPSSRRLIPAHAGKTDDSTARNPGFQAHPRSRGENIMAFSVHSGVQGSSPLTRGKHSRRPDAERRDRLIPAHAGKTLPDMRFYCADRSDLGNP